MIKLPALALALFFAVVACDTPPSDSTGGDASTSITETDGASESGRLTSSTGGDDSSGEDTSTGEGGSTTGSTGDGASSTGEHTTTSGDTGSSTSMPEVSCPDAATCSDDADCDANPATVNTVPRCVGGSCRLQCVPPIFPGMCGEDSECQVDENGTGNTLCSC